MGSRNLSKSKYLAGKQCVKRLWLACHAGELGETPDAATRAALDTGTEVGELARRLFPGGRLVEEAAYQHEEAVRRTRSLMATGKTTTIFEAAFEGNGVRVRVDILERLVEGVWGVREVKSATDISDVHVDDVAIQCHVLEGCGLAVRSAELIHINKHYVRGEAGVDLSRLFTRSDITNEVRVRRKEVPAVLNKLWRALDLPEAPKVEPSRHCQRPYHCEFWAHCTQDKPRDWILTLPRLRRKQLKELRMAGVERISQIPEGFCLTALQHRVRRVAISGREFVSPGLAGALASFGPPADYLDFETMSTAIPLYPGTRPYQVIPFQWSLHRVDGKGDVSHLEFLAGGDGDPRPRLAETLLEALEDTKAPIVVYSPFEAAVMSDLGRLFPEFAGRLRRARRRLRDLLSVVRGHVYHPDFNGSFSIKKVAGALNPGFGYDDLSSIAEGSQASAAFAAIAQRKLSEADATRLRRDLLAYCRRDTQALLMLHWALLRRLP